MLNSKMVGCAVNVDTSFAQCLNREYRTVNKARCWNLVHHPFTYKRKQTTRGEIKLKLYAANTKSNNSVGDFINISFKDRLLINIYEITEFCGYFLTIFKPKGCLHIHHYACLVNGTANMALDLF